MSISTPGGEPRRPSLASKAVAGGKPATGDSDAATSDAKAEPTKTGAGKTAAGKTGTGRTSTSKAGTGKAGGRPAGARPAGARPGGGGKGRKPVTPVKVHQDRAWGPIALAAAVGLLAVAIVGYGAWAVYQGGRSWEDKANAISGIANFRKSDPKSLEYERHQPGKLQWTAFTPPVGGVHNQAWQNCTGDVYDAPIANEHAVHSLEHGAVWIAYRPDLPAGQVNTLASKVRGQDKMMMSPYEGLDKPISLQAWGYQLKVDSADDGRIDEFIKALRSNASIEPQATCAQGITATGTTPRDNLPGDQPQQQ